MNSKSIENLSQSKVKFKDSKLLMNFHRPKENEKIGTVKHKHILLKKKAIKKEYHINYNDFELNSFAYNEALLYDNRTYIQYYKSLLKVKHPILFAFVPNNDYNTMIIKISIFFFSFSLYFVMNACFFDEVAIHQIYKDEGEYNFSVFALPIFLSFIFAHILSTIIKYVFLSERNIYEIRKEIELNKVREKQDSVKRIIIIKYIIFFIAGTVLLFFFWYYLSSFGAVYQNTQVFLIKNTFISVLISLIYPFIINLLPGIFRIYSLKDAKNKKEGFFIFSKILQII